MISNLFGGKLVHFFKLNYSYLNNMCTLVVFCTHCALCALFANSYANTQNSRPVEIPLGLPRSITLKVGVGRMGGPSAVWVASSGGHFGRKNRSLCTTARCSGYAITQNSRPVEIPLGPPCSITLKAGVGRMSGPPAAWVASCGGHFGRKKRFMCTTA